MPINTKIVTVKEFHKRNSYQIELVCDDGEYVVDRHGNINLYYLAYGIGCDLPMRAALHIDTSHNQVIEINVIGKV